MGNLYKKIIFPTLLFISTSLFADVAKVVSLKGEAVIIRNNKTIELKRTSLIEKNDRIETKNNTKIQLLFKDETIVSIGKNSKFLVSEYFYDEKEKNYEVKFSMFQGTFRTITGKIGKIAPKKFNLKTKSASIGIRGTQIVMNLSPKLEQIFCTEGKIFVEKNDTGISSVVKAGEFVNITKDISTLKIQKIKDSNIKKINQNLSIKKNLATDNITIKDENNTNENSEPPKTVVALNNNQKSVSKTLNTEEKTVESEINQLNKEKNEENKKDNSLSKEKITEQINDNKANAENDIKKADENMQKAEKEKAEAEEKERKAQEDKTLAEAEAKKAQEEKALAEAKKKKAQEEAIAAAAAAQAAKTEAERQKALEEVRKAQEEKLKAEKEAQELAQKQAAAEEEAKKLAQEQAAAAAAAAQAEKERLAAEEAAKIAAQEAAAAEEVITELEEVDKKPSSLSRYKGDFNNYSYNLTNQYYKRFLLPLPISNRSTIEMNIDFSASKNQISDGKILMPRFIFSDYKFDFKGNITGSKFTLEGEKTTTGFGSGSFSGSNNENMTGKVDFHERTDDIDIKAQFDAVLYDDTLNEITPESYFDQADSIAHYKGDFNNYKYDSGKQYIKYKNSKNQIPENSYISMDIDFGASKNHISNGKIEVDSSKFETFEFDGEIKKDSKFELDGINNTKGDGEGSFFGPEAQLLVGDVDFKRDDTLEKTKIKGQFQATKQ